MQHYRRIWEKINGPTPIDEQGRKYEIHHLDGNRNNNDLSNLACISIKEHYEIHYKQGDYGAAFRIAQRMGIDPKIKSQLASMANKQRIDKGEHPFLDKQVRKKAANKVAKRVKKGIQGLQNKEVMNKAIKAKKEKYTKDDFSSFAKKGWDKWKQEGNDVKSRTKKGSIEGAKKTKNTAWYHDLNGKHLRTFPDDPRLKNGWIKGRFNGKELSRKANLTKLKNKQ